jgi:hypothetical protein
MTRGNRSKRANQYGTLTEMHAADRYNLKQDGEYTSWCDARGPDGTPHEIKATMVTRGYLRFRIFEKYHRRLQFAGRRYVLVAYRPHSRGIVLLKSRRIHASKLPLSTWYGAWGHRDSRQVKLSLEAIF